MNITLNQKTEWFFELLLDGTKIASAYLDNKEDGIVQRRIPPEIKKDLNNRSIYVFGVLKPFQGKGYGKIFLQKLIEWCKENNVQLLTLGVYKDNPAAIHLYESVGFKTMKDDGHLYMYMEI